MRQFRKPLIVMSPKSLLRHPACRSYLYEFDNIPDDYYIEGVRFKRLMMDKHATDRSPRPEPVKQTKRLVLCTGKVYFDLDAKRDELGLGEEVRGGAVQKGEELGWGDRGKVGRGSGVWWVGLGRLGFGGPKFDTRNSVTLS